MNRVGSQRQGGAAAVFVALSLTASLAALALTLDLGQLYFAHRDLQRMADMAALDASRAAGGCLGEIDDPFAAANAEAGASVARNGGQLPYLTAGNVQIGREANRGDVRTFVPDDGPDADSVRVTLRRPFPARLIPLFTSGSTDGTLTASAAAKLRPIVSLDVGSTLARVSSPVLNNLLSGMLGSRDLALSVGSFRGLFDASVSLGNLALAANAGSVDEFLGAETSAPGFLDAIAGALSAGTDTAVRTTLDALAAGADASRRVVPRDVMGVPVGGAADDAMVNVGALVTALAQAANGGNLLNLTLPLDAPPLLGTTTVTVRLIELARPAIGPAGDDGGVPQTFARTAQALVQVTARLAPLLGNPVTLAVFTQVADAGAGVTGLSCAQRGRPQPSVMVDARTGIGNAGIGDYADINAQNLDIVPTTLVKLNLMGVPLRIKAKAVANLGEAEARSLVFDGPFPSAPQTIGTSPGEALARAMEDAGSNVSLSVEGLPGGALNAPLNQALQPLLTALTPQIAAALRELDQSALQPLLEVLGVSVGAAQVRVRSIVADQPVLFAR